MEKNLDALYWSIIEKNQDFNDQLAFNKTQIVCNGWTFFSETNKQQFVCITKKKKRKT